MIILFFLLLASNAAIFFCYDLWRWMFYSVLYAKNTHDDVILFCVVCHNLFFSTRPQTLDWVSTLIWLMFEQQVKHLSMKGNVRNIYNIHSWSSVPQLLYGMILSTCLQILKDKSRGGQFIFMCDALYYDRM